MIPRVPVVVVVSSLLLPLVTLGTPLLSRFLTSPSRSFPSSTSLSFPRRAIREGKRKTRSFRRSRDNSVVDATTYLEVSSEETIHQAVAKNLTTERKSIARLRAAVRFFDYYDLTVLILKKFIMNHAS